MKIKTETFSQVTRILETMPDCHDWDRSHILSESRFIKPQKH